jgi:hypothetical protein
MNPRALATACCVLLALGGCQSAAPPAAGTATPAISREGTAQALKEPAPYKAEEIEALVAPIALNPDPLLSQVLMASTYPL